MKVLLLLAVGMSVAKGSTAPPSATDCSGPGPEDGHSLLSSLLQVAGYSDTCVAAALDYCSSPQEDGHFASLMEEARGIVQQVSLMVNNSESRPRHCKDLLDSGDSGKGLRLVYPYPGRPHQRVTVYCDHTVDGGGWTVFQRRTNETIRQDFYRTLIEYQLGFGDLEGEFWLGLDILHQLTSTTLQELRIDLADYEGAHRWAKYGFFHVGTQVANYYLSVGRYIGDAGDGLAFHNGKTFSISVPYRGGWWYTPGHHANLNGQPHVGHHTSYADGIGWFHWRGHNYSMRRTSMMIRPAF